MTKNLSELVNKLTSELDDSVIKDLDEKDLIKMRQMLSPYGTTIEGSKNYLTMSYTYIEQEYLKKLLMTGLIGFLNRMCDEWKVPDDILVTPVYEYVKDPSILDKNVPKKESADRKKKRLFNKKWMEKRIIVKQFLEEFFQFDPDIHVRSSYTPHTKDSSRNKIYTPPVELAMWSIKKEAEDSKNKNKKKEYNDIYNKFKQDFTNAKKNGEYKKQTENVKLKQTSQKISKGKTEISATQKYNNIIYNDENDDGKDDEKVDMRSLNDKIKEKEKMKKEKEKKKKKMHEDNMLKANIFNMIPPKDIFCKFKIYFENNYEQLEQCVKDLYGAEKIFKLAINPLAWHKTKEEADRFVKKHSKEFITDVVTLYSGKWNVLEPYKENRENVDYFTEKTVVLEEMLKQMEQDAKIGTELLKKKVKVKKIKNILEHGPDDAGLKYYKKKFGTEVNPVGDINPKKEMYKYRVLEEPDNAVEVPVYRISKGGIQLDKDVFYTEEDLPDSLK